MRGIVRSLSLDADPQDVIEFLKEADIAVPPNADKETFNRCLTDFIRLWNEGKIGIILNPEE
jgi:hypothetical protein